MKREIALLFILPFIMEALNYSGKSYYFKISGNNEFTVFNRVQFLNHNISDLNVNPHHNSQNVLNKPQETREVTQKNSSKKFFLDAEWNYDHHMSINKSKFPLFIKKIYQQRLEEPGNMNTIRILFNTNNKNNSSKFIKFDLSSLADEKVSDADMYFYWPLENTSSIFRTAVVLRLYQLDSEDSYENILSGNPDTHKLFNVIYISKAQKGWQTFKIKKPVDNWANGEPNFGLLLTISSYKENKLLTIFNDTNEGVFRTFAVLTIDKNKGNQQQFVIGKNSSIDSIGFTSGCSRRPWHLDFKHLHWNNVVLYPEEGLMAYQCSGKCLMDDEKNNHVNLRHFFNGHHGFRERICCVPKEYFSVPLMYLDKFGNVVLKNYDDMIVKTCVCS
ncbi:hypothetical protein ABEB36_003844 [Hypothenemus hampei]|uniref:TGF-beta family profile domain-containing protein n=1 Tax=Hypothenemus hampei TaxID=57062 RepID=A0ABD1F1A8_HYPHA